MPVPASQRKSHPLKSLRDKDLTIVRAPARRALAAVCLLALVACSTPPAPDGISDPNEAQNRATHQFNLGLDRNVLRPLGQGADKALPEPVAKGISNFANNLEIPGDVVNNVLQLRMGKALENTLRFVLNTTIGVGGLFDPAAAAGVYGKKTDFGETLHVWGVPEGNYIELPVLGPSTDRDALGEVVDIAMNPLGMLLPNERDVPLIARIAGLIVDRGRYSETFDSILYESADSYAQARLLYLQNRRFELGQAPADDSFEDPYAE